MSGWYGWTHRILDVQLSRVKHDENGCPSDDQPWFYKFYSCVIGNEIDLGWSKSYKKWDIKFFTYPRADKKREVLEMMQTGYSVAEFDE